jgi:hypothetical protein
VNGWRARAADAGKCRGVKGDPTVPLPAAAGLAFELDQDEMHGLIANVLCSMGQRIAVDNIARLERALRDLAICCVVAIPTSSQNINDIGRVRVNLLLGTLWQNSFEDADTNRNSLVR